MADMWRNRAKPTPLVFDGIKDGSFSLEHKSVGGALQVNGGSSRQPADAAVMNGATVGGSAATEMMLDTPSSSSASSSKVGTGLKDQRALTLQDNLHIFIER